MFRSVALCRRAFNIVGRKFSTEKPPSSSRGPVTIASLGLAAIAGAGILLFYNYEKEKKMESVIGTVKTIGKPALGGPWVLVDSDGNAKSDEDFFGKFTLIYFGFTYCPDICPSELVKVGKIMNVLESKNCNAVQPLFISVDPARDSIGQLKHYSQDFHKKIVYLTGTKDQVAVATRAYRVYFSKANENELNEEDYLVDHSIVLYLVAPNGEFVDFFTQKLQVGEISDKILKYVKEYNDQHPSK